MMRLVITKKREPKHEADTYYLGTHYLKMKSVHMFIAKHTWDSIELELTDEIPEGALRFMHNVCADIKIKCPDTVNDVTIRQLAELYPDKGGKIRRCHFSGSNVLEVIPECLLSDNEPC